MAHHNHNNPQNHVVTGYPIPSESYPPPQSTRVGFSRPPGKFEAVVVVGCMFSITMLLIFSAWLVIDMAPPSLPEFRVNNASLSNFNVSSIELKSNWEFHLLVRNPDIMHKFNYEQVNGSVFFRDKLVTQKLLPPFYQKKKTNKDITFSFSMDSSTYLDEAAGREIVWERNNNVVSFDLRMSISIIYGGFNEAKMVINVLCEDIKFKLSSNSSSPDGIMLGGTYECQVKSDKEEDESEP